MPSTMNHLYHTLAPLIVYTAFLVSLLAFLAPVPIFPERVNLLSVKIGSSSSSTSSNVTRRWVPDDAHPRRMVKRAAAAKTQAESKTDRAGFEIVYGPLGACVSRDSSNDFACTTPTFTPAFHDLYSSINGSALPSKVEAVLPDQFPLAPTGLFASLVLIASQLLAVVASSISMHLNKKGKGPQWIVKRQPGMRKIATGTGFVGLVLILVTAISLRVQLSDTIKKLEGVGQVGSATLGSGFAQFFACAALEAVVLILLVAEAFTSR